MLYLAVVVAFFAGTVGARSINADTITAPLASFKADVAVDSGWVQNASNDSAVIWQHQVAVLGADWLRIRFLDVQLGRTIDGRSGAHLRLTSALDGAVQTMHAEHVHQWRGTSAYFNGDTVEIEIVAEPGSGPCRVQIDRAIAGVPSGAPRNLCDGVDDRVLSDDPRSARIEPVGCTGWLINDANYCFLTAGHCVANSTADVIEFNVPLSMPSGAIVHPPPEDQYAVDVASIQNQTGTIEIGNDWAYYGVFPNSTTGLTPFETQGDRFVLAETIPAPAGQTLRKTGFGSTASPIPNEWNLVQKTMAGPFTVDLGTGLGFRIDSSGGDSGSPVFVDGTDVAYAVHTNGGCNAASPNWGTAVTQVDLVAALTAPIGICKPDFFDFEYPDGRPTLIHADGGTTLRVDVIPRNLYEVAPDGGLLHFDAGDGWQTTPFGLLGGTAFEATFPAIPCAREVRYYVSFTTTDGGSSPDPLDAPDLTYLGLSGRALVTLATYDFESTTGWLVTNQNVTSGGWVAGIPVGMGMFGTPLADYDGSGSCYLTGNTSGDEDLDGGPTRLWSPAVDMLQAENPAIRFAQWFTNSNLDADRLTVELSNNSVVNFTQIAAYSHHDEWREESYFVRDTFAAPASVRARFVASDNPNDSRTEAAVDAVAFLDVRCEATCIPGDANGDSIVDGGDIRPFAATILDPPAPESAAFCAADVDGDGSLTVVGDVPAFVTCVLNAGCP